MPRPVIRPLVRTPVSLAGLSSLWTTRVSTWAVSIAPRGARRHRERVAGGLARQHDRQVVVEFELHRRVRVVAAGDVQRALDQVQPAGGVGELLDVAAVDDGVVDRADRDGPLRRTRSAEVKVSASWLDPGRRRSRTRAGARGTRSAGRSSGRPCRGCTDAIAVSRTVTVSPAPGAMGEAHRVGGLGTELAGRWRPRRGGCRRRSG